MNIYQCFLATGLALSLTSFSWAKELPQSSQRESRLMAALMDASQVPGGYYVHEVHKALGLKKPDFKAEEIFLAPLVEKQISSILEKSEYSQDSEIKAHWFHSDSGVSGFIYSNATDVFLQFTGTHEKRNYIQNGSFAMNFEYSPHHFHSGFLKAWIGVEDIVKKRLLEHESYKKNIHLGGHSYGGAMAHLATYFLAQNYFSQCSLTTFASPAVGNLQVASQIESLCRTERFWRSNDIVPIVLDGEHGNIWNWSDVYHHAGYSIRMDSVFLGKDQTLSKPPRFVYNAQIRNQDRLAAVATNWLKAHDWILYREIMTKYYP